MKIINHINEIGGPFVVTIGKFDGLHKGHQKLLDHLLKLADQFQAKSCVVTFTPHPNEVLGHEDKGFLINSYKEKEILIKNLNIDCLVSLSFNQGFSVKSPELFILEYLESVHLKAIHLGHDFSFGANKRGDYKFIQSHFSKTNIQVTVQEQLIHQGEGVSSTRVRELVRKGEFPGVEELLGRYFFISGVVIKGEGRGRKIGFPTANINIEEKRVAPSLGVYITRTWYRDYMYHSVTNIGVNPTFKGIRRPSIETYIFDFDQDIYGEIIRVEFIRKIREEVKFCSVADLVDQINKDVILAKEFFRD